MATEELRKLRPGDKVVCMVEKVDETDKVIWIHKSCVEPYTPPPTSVAYDREVFRRKLIVSLAHHIGVRAHKIDALDDAKDLLTSVEAIVEEYERYMEKRAEVEDE